MRLDLHAILSWEVSLIQSFWYGYSPKLGLGSSGAFTWIVGFFVIGFRLSEAIDFVNSFQSFRHAQLDRPTTGTSNFMAVG